MNSEWTVRDGWLLNPEGDSVVPLEGVTVDEVRRLVASLNVHRDIPVHVLEEIAGDESKRQDVAWWGSQGLLVARRREREGIRKANPSRLHLAVENET